MVAIEGSGVVESPAWGAISFMRKGEAVVIPASVREYRRASAMGAGDHAHGCRAEVSAGTRNRIANNPSGAPYDISEPRGAILGGQIRRNRHFIP